MLEDKLKDLVHGESETDQRDCVSVLFIYIFHMVLLCQAKSILASLFSFPLGACLSEMTFPRRQLIRHSASLASADSLVCFTSTETQLLLEVPKWIA